MASPRELLVLTALFLFALVVVGFVIGFGLWTVLAAGVVIVFVAAWALRLTRRHQQTVASQMPHHDVRAERPARELPKPMAEPERPVHSLELVDEAGDESFPASDPPAWTLGETDQPVHRNPPEPPNTTR